MATAKQPVIAPSMSDAAAKAATGKTWAEWFAILDAANAAAMTHKQIVKLLAANHDVGGWWQQMVTVTYEKARGMRQTHETTDGYQVGASKTLNVPIERLFEAGNDPARRAEWLDEPNLVVTKATPTKSVRIRWPDGTRVWVGFYAKGEERAQVAVDHERLPDAGAGQRMKAYWKARLERLQVLIGRT